MKKFIYWCTFGFLMVTYLSCNSPIDVNTAEIGIDSKILRLVILRNDNVISKDNKLDTFMLEDIETTINQGALEINMNIPKYIAKHKTVYSFRPFFVLDNKAKVSKIAYDSKSTNDFNLKDQCTSVTPVGFNEGDEIEFKYFEQETPLHGSAQLYKKKHFCDLVITVSPQVGDPSVYTLQVREAESSEAKVLSFEFHPINSPKYSNNQLKEPMKGAINQTTRHITFDSVAYDFRLDRMVATISIMDKHARALLNQDNYIVPFSVTQYSEKDDNYEVISDSALNLESVVFFSVRTESGNDIPYKVYVPRKKDPRNTEARIKSMKFLANNNTLLDKDVIVNIDQINNEYSFELPFASFKLTEDLIPTIEFSTGATSTVVTNDKMDFKKGKKPIILVTSENGKIQTTYNLISSGVIFNDQRSTIAAITKYEFLKENQPQAIKDFMTTRGIDKYPYGHPDDKITTGNVSGIPEEIIINLHWEVYEHLEKNNDLKLVPSVVTADAKAKLVNAIDASGYQYFLPGRGGNVFQPILHQVRAERENVLESYVVKLKNYIDVNTNPNINTFVLSKDDFPAYKWKKDLEGAVNNGSSSISMTVPYGFDFTKFKPTITFQSTESTAISGMELVKESKSSSAVTNNAYNLGDIIDFGTKDYESTNGYFLKVTAEKASEIKKYKLIIDERQASQFAVMNTYRFTSQKDNTIEAADAPASYKGKQSLIMENSLSQYVTDLGSNHNYDYVFDVSEFATIHLMKLNASNEYVSARVLPATGSLDLSVMKDTVIQVVSQSTTVKNDYRIRYVITPTVDAYSFKLQIPGNNDANGQAISYTATKKLEGQNVKLTVAVPSVASFDKNTDKFKFILVKHPEAKMTGDITTATGDILLNTEKRFTISMDGKATTYIVKVVDQPASS